MTHHYRQYITASIWSVGEYRDKKRPILINNWEATYFDFNTDKLLKDCKAGIKSLGSKCWSWTMVGSDTVMMTARAWVTGRSMAEGAAGGLKLLVDRVNAMGLKFGIWFEPEMISPDSDLKSIPTG